MKHDWASEDCYHRLPPAGYCGYKRYFCRACNKSFCCAMYLPEGLLNEACPGLPGKETPRQDK